MHTFVFFLFAVKILKNMK